MQVRKAVITAAGLGTRFLPITKSQPKEMLPLVNKPLIQYAVEEIIGSGIREIIIVIAPGKGAIRDYFCRSSNLEEILLKKGQTELVGEIRELSNLPGICCVMQRRQLGLGHAILTAREVIGDEPFAVVLPDDIVDSDVYFNISSFNGYGKLSGRDIEHMQAGARIVVDTRKKNPLDFALWKASKPDEPSWDSHWGAGRPGWHIECSVMAMRYAGCDTLDIHAGGQDLIFPHHENEIAQSESATGKPFARYWLHNGFLDIEGEKMSKSLGNFLTVNDILKSFDPMSIRMFFLLKHYRSPIDFSEERMKEASTALDRLRNAYLKMTRILEKAVVNVPKDKEINKYNEIIKNNDSIIESMDDDFNTAKAIGHLFEIAKIVNFTEEKDIHAPIIMKKAKEVFDTFSTDVFGLTFETKIEKTKETEIINHTADFIIPLRNEYPDDKSWDVVGFNLANAKEHFNEIGMRGTIDTLVEIRIEARKNKNFALSDNIRDRLKEIGITLEDRPDGTSWKM